MPLKKGNQLAPAAEVRQSLSWLLSELTAELPQRRLAAALALADQPEATTALCSQLAIEQDPQVQQTILTGFMRHPAVESAQQLAAMLSSADIGLKNQIAEILAHYPPELLPMVAAALTDPAPTQRLIWLQILSDWPAELLSGLLVPRLQLENDVNVFAAMVELLTQTGDPRFLTALQQVSTRFQQEPYIQYLVAQSMSRLRS